MYLNSPSIVYRHTQWTFISTCVNSDMTVVVEGSHRGSVFTAFFFGVVLIIFKHLIGREAEEAGRGEREKTEDATNLQRSQK